MGDLKNVTMRGDRGELEDIGNSELGHAVIDIFIEDLVEDLSGFRLKIFPEIDFFFPQSLRPFTTSP